MSVVLSLREMAGSSIYLRPQIGHTLPACSLLPTAAASFRLLWSAVGPQGDEAQFLAVDVRRPDDLGKGCVARHVCGDIPPGLVRTVGPRRPGNRRQRNGIEPRESPPAQRD